MLKNVISLALIAMIIVQPVKAFAQESEQAEGAAAVSVEEPAGDTATEGAEEITGDTADQATGESAIATSDGREQENSDVLSCTTGDSSTVLKVVGFVLGFAVGYILVSALTASPDEDEAGGSSPAVGMKLDF